MYVEGIVGEIRAFAHDTVPDNWLQCNGRIMQIRGDYTALFSLVGTYYGGDGRSTFALPDLRAKLGVHFSHRREIGAQAHAVSGREPTEQQGFLALNYCICAQGMFPERP